MSILSDIGTKIGNAFKLDRDRLDTLENYTSLENISFWAWADGGFTTTALHTPIIFSSTVSNNGNDYNPANGRFTVSKAGTYNFDGMLLYRQSSNNTPGEWYFSLNGNNIGNRGNCYAGGAGASDAHFPASSNLIINLNVGDYIEMKIHSVGSGNFYYGEKLGHFSGNILK